MKNLLTLFVVLAVAIPFMAPRADAQFTFIPYAGYDLEFEALFVGAAVEFALPVAGFPVGLAIRPGAEYYFLESNDFFNQSLFQINGDVVAELMPDGPIGVYAGAGLAIGFFSFDTDFGFGEINGSDTELGLNLFGGAEFGTGFAVPFAQIRLTTPGTTRIQLMGGVKLSL